MTKIFGLALAGFLSMTQFAGAFGFAHDSARNLGGVSDRPDAQERLNNLLREIDDLRHEAETKLDETDLLPEMRDQDFAPVAETVEQPLDDASFSLILSSDSTEPALRFDEAVTAVPLPSAGFLLLAGLGGLGLVRRKTRG